jgi:hypothetical protein
MAFAKHTQGRPDRWSVYLRSHAPSRGLTSSVGRPMDGALAIARLMVRGLFEKFPQLKLVASHLG